MFIIGIHLFFRYLIESGLIFKAPVFFGVSLPFPLIHGPLLLFYVQELTQIKHTRSFYNYLHFLFPALLYLYLITYFALPKERMIATIKNDGAEYQVFNVTLFLGAIFSGIVYVLWSIGLLRKHTTNIIHKFSYTDKINLNWLRYLSYGLGVIWLVVIISNFLVKDWLDVHVQNRDIVIYYTVVGFVILIGFYGVKQVGIFSIQLENSINNEYKNDDIPLVAEPPVKEKRYEKSGLTADKADELHKKLLHLMKTEKLFLNNELTLNDFASKLEIHPNYLSQVINDKIGMNFYDFVNEYRVIEFKSILNNPDKKNFTMLALAFECGFNSKSSFNKYFKKSTGTTPSDFSKSQKE